MGMLALVHGLTMGLTLAKPCPFQIKAGILTIEGNGE